MATRNVDDSAVQHRYCTRCGADATGAAFCPACGAPLESAELPGERAPFPRYEASLHRAAKGFDSATQAHARGIESPDVHVPPSDGGISAESLSEATLPLYPRDPSVVLGAERSSAEATPGATRHRRLLIAVVSAAVFAVAGGAVAAVLLLRGHDTTGSYGQKVATAVRPLTDDNRSLSDALANLHGTDTHVAQVDVTRAQSASSAARGALNALAVPDGSQPLVSAARQALDREDTYLGAVAAALGNPSSPAVSQLQPLAGNLTTALDAAGGPVAGASQSVSGADLLTSWAQRAAHQRQAVSNNGSSGAQSQSGANAQAQSAGPYAAGRDCGGGLHAGPNTSCEFAQNVRNAYNVAPGSTASVTVYSPVTGQTYVMDCSPSGAGVTCSGGNGASVSW